jgi:hypothetical protein
VKLLACGTKRAFKNHMYEGATHDQSACRRDKTHGWILVIIYSVAITNRAQRSQITSGEPRVRMRGARASNADRASSEDGARSLATATATAPARRRRDELAPRIGSGGDAAGVMMPRAKRVACGARTHVERRRQSTTRPAHPIDRVQAHHSFC